MGRRHHGPKMALAPTIFRTGRQHRDLYETNRGTTGLRDRRDMNAAVRFFKHFPMKLLRRTENTPAQRRHGHVVAPSRGSLSRDGTRAAAA
jgi:hypothetical protein